MTRQSPAANHSGSRRLDQNGSAHQAQEGATRPKLTARQADAIELAMLGLTNRQIAERLNVSTYAIKLNLSSAYRKLAVANRTQAAVAYLNYREDGQTGMDLSLFFAVLWRSRRLMVGGVLLGAVLAVLAYGRPGFSGARPTITPRFGEVWQSEAQLLIGQSDYPYRQPAEATEPSRALGSLSPIYANLANGNIVQAEIRARLGRGGSVKASEDVDLAASSFLPFVNFVATAPTPTEATKFARGAVSIFEAYVARQQAAAGVPPSRSVQLSIVDSGADPKLVEGHKLSIPLLVFVAILIGTVALALVRENIRPRAAKALGHVVSATPSQGSLADTGSLPSDAAYARPNRTHDETPAVHRDPAMAGNAQQ